MQGDNHPTTRALAEARERTIAKLAESFAHDELSLEAFEQRVNDAYTRTTTEELAALTRDLGAAPDEAAVAALARATPAAALARATPAAVAQVIPAAGAVVVPARRTVLAVLGSVERRGALEMGERTNATAVLGSLEIDLRETPLPPGVTELHVRAVLGSVEIVVPANLDVEVQGTGILGSFDSRVRVLPGGRPPEAPRLRIVGTAILGSIEVRARPPVEVEMLVKQLRHRT